MKRKSLFSCLLPPPPPPPLLGVFPFPFFFFFFVGGGGGGGKRKSLFSCLLPPPPPPSLSFSSSLLFFAGGSCSNFRRTTRAEPLPTQDNCVVILSHLLLYRIRIPIKYSDFNFLILIAENRNFTVFIFS